MKPNLYKYVTCDRVDVLQNLAIRFSPIQALNDPFDSRISGRMVDHQLPPRIDANYVSHLLMRKGQGKEPLPISEFRARSQKYIEDHRDLLGAEWVKHMELAMQAFRILCLSKVAPSDPYSMLLWSHYTDSHKGFAIEFDGMHNWHSPVSKIQGRSGDVSYAEKRPIIDDSDAAGFVFQKSAMWAYEKEYRVVRFVPTATDLDRTVLDSLSKVPPECVKSVTLGALSSDATHYAVKSAISTCTLSHVKLFKCFPDTYEYAFRIELL